MSGAEGQKERKGRGGTSGTCAALVGILEFEVLLESFKRGHGVEWAWLLAVCGVDLKGVQGYQLAGHRTCAEIVLLRQARVMGADEGGVCWKTTLQ